MDPATLIPAPDTLPTTWPWFEVLLILCFVLHLLFMNAMLGSAVIGWTHVLRGRELETARRIGKCVTFCIAFAINFGVATLLFMQVLYGHLFYTSSILMAVWWLSALGLVLAAYGSAYWIDFKFHGLGSRRTLIWTFIVAALLLVGFVFVSNLTLMQDPGAWSRYFKAPAGMLWHWSDATVIPRYLHFMTASVAVGGLVLAMMHRHGPSEKSAGGMLWFTAATALQFIIGGWFYISLPPAIRLALMGGNVKATAFFVSALSAAVVALTFGIRQRLWPAAGAAIATVLAMVLVRDAIRAMYLAPFFNVEQLTVQPQYSPMLVFGLFLALGVISIGFMVRLYLRAKGVRTQ